MCDIYTNYTDEDSQPCNCNNLPIMLALCLMLSGTYYAKNNILLAYNQPGPINDSNTFQYDGLIIILKYF